MCYRCKDSGHLARNCPKPRCDKCQRYPASCICEPVWGYDRPDTEPQNDSKAEDSNVENDNATNDEQMEEDEEVKNDDRDDVDDALNLDDRDDSTDVKENSDVNTAQDELNLDENPNTDSSNNTPDDDDEQTEVMTVHEHSKDNLIDNEIIILHKKGGSKKVNESVSHESNVDIVDCDHDKNVESSIASESEMEITDEELARSMGKKRRRRLVTSPNLTPEDIKKMKSNPKSKLSPNKPSSSS
ncbi:DNA polymerase epsilon subunit 2-like [Mytilus californianus]|uniref:DNA polymerase epsilon subunit 2-like n=1 Tax=Mytilus californianus TaxID=6549 RepID=UPI0022452170|nr:DNA polymerase epsilon subunit 2-like [Mytilus californianus]